MIKIKKGYSNGVSSNDISNYISNVKVFKSPELKKAPNSTRVLVQPQKKCKVWR